MLRSGYARRALVLLASVALAGSCREAPTPFESIDRDDRTIDQPVQLTFNAGTDHTPVWSVGGDSIYYAAASFTGLPSRSNGVLLALSAQSGPAQVVLPELQSDVQLERWLTGPAISPDGQRIAFVDLYTLAIPSDCALDCPNAPQQEYPGFPELDSLRIRVFSLATRSLAGEITVRFNDRAFDLTRPAPGVSGTWVFDMTPYQLRWSLERTPVFRPTWSPDGTRLAFSDGSQLQVWTVGQSTTQPVPNTGDAMFPAWSPDGQTIAYTHAERGNRISNVCNCLNIRGQLSELQDRIRYSGSHEIGTLTLIRPDGSDKREIGSGDAPAWTPNGRLVFRRFNSLYTSAADGSGAVAIAGTESGHVPSVSPDGRLITFAKQTGTGRGFDIWVAPLAGAQ